MQNYESYIITSRSSVVHVLTYIDPNDELYMLSKSTWMSACVLSLAGVYALTKLVLREGSLFRPWYGINELGVVDAAG